MAKDNALDRFLNRWKQNRDDVRLFQHLADVHEPDPAQQELLGAIAERESVVRLSEIFVRPALVERSPDPSRWPAPEVKRLRQRLFEGPQPGEWGAAADA